MKRINDKYLDIYYEDYDQAISHALNSKKNGEAISIGLLGNAADILSRLLDDNIIEDILKELDLLSLRNVKEVTLLGQNVDSYGHDFLDKKDLADLFYAVNEIKGIERIIEKRIDQPYIQNRFGFSLASQEIIRQAVLITDPNWKE